MTDTEKPSVTEIATTEDTGLPVFRVAVGDDHAEVILEDGTMYVPSVWAPGDAGLRGVMDAAVQTFNPELVKFTNVISPRLEQTLEGFEVEEQTHPAIGETVKVLAGEWEVRS